MRVVSLSGHMACCEAKGVRRDVSLTLIGDQHLEVGDFVLVHVGYAIQLISADDARSTWDLFDEITMTLDRTGA
jgi:hydrogenase expression/formation protein HypC